MCKIIDSVILINKEKGMSYEVKVEIKDDYLLAVASGTFGVKEYRELLVDILFQCIENSKSKLLFDVRTFKGNLSTFQRFTLATYFATLSRQHPETAAIQVAVVGHPPLIDPNRFGETVAKNHGVNIKVTTDIDEAVEWLQG